jgi:hypothetical protein
MRITLASKIHKKSNLRLAPLSSKKSTSHALASHPAHQVHEPAFSFAGHRVNHAKHLRNDVSWDWEDSETSFAENIEESSWISYFDPPYCNNYKKQERLSDNFVLGATLGIGRYGVVYSGLDLKLKKNVAIKSLNKNMLREQPDGQKMINTEVHLLKMLPTHPNICQFYRAVETNTMVRPAHPDIPLDGELRSRHALLHVHGEERDRSRGEVLHEAGGPGAGSAAQGGHLPARREDHEHGGQG